MRDRYIDRERADRQTGEVRLLLCTMEKRYQLLGAYQKLKGPNHSLSISRYTTDRQIDR